MGMSIQQLRALLAVAHTLNFAHASERLNMSQPALSLAIKGLEDSLGGALLLRTTRKVTLTQEGETLLNMGRQLLADWENTEEAMRQRFTLQRGKISIAAMPSFAANVLPSVLKTFRDSYSGINVTVHDVINEHVIEMVSEGRVEMGIAFEPDYWDICISRRSAWIVLSRLCRQPVGWQTGIVLHGANCRRWISSPCNVRQPCG